MTGTYEMVFTIWNDPRSTDPADIVWSERRAGITIQDGHLDVVLGDPGTWTGPLDHTVFADRQRYLEIQIVGEPNPLAPRFRLVSSPYAFHSSRTESVDGARGGTIAGSVEVTDQLLVGGTANVGGFKLSDGAERSAVLTSDASGNGSWRALPTIAAGELWSLAGNSGTDHQVDFLGTTDRTALVLRVNDRPALRIRPSPTAPDFGLSEGGNCPSLLAGNEQNVVATGVSGATIGGGGWVADGETRINQVVGHFGTVGGGAGNLAGSKDDVSYGTYATVAGGHSNRATSGSATVGGGYSNRTSAVFATVAGGRKNTATDSDATVAGGVNNEASGSASTVAGGSGNVAHGDYSFAAGRNAHARHDGSFVWADHSGEELYSQEEGEMRVRAGGGFTLARGDGRASFKIEPESVNGAGQVTLYLDDGTGTVELTARDKENDEAGDEEGGRLSLLRGDGRKTIVLDANEGGAQGSVIKLYNRLGSSGSPTIELDADYGDSRRGRVITDVLEITGADLAENFPVRDAPSGSRSAGARGRADSPADGAGLVVVIDGTNPGGLVVSSRPYDPAVAGVISGAGGLAPGLLLGRDDRETDDDRAVALKGRVFAWADASTAPIRPGDLLTTSGTPGHVMRVTDFERARGAVIGKAMSSLERGRGLVLVLVALQ